MAENSPNLRKEMYIQFLEAHSNWDEFEEDHIETHYHQTYQNQKQRVDLESSKWKVTHHTRLLSFIISVSQ